MMFNFFKKDTREKIYYRNVNSLLNDVYPHFRAVKIEKAQAVVLWADTRGRLREIALQAKKLKKPLVIVQHGRGAVREYLPPVNAELIADKICVWGPIDRDKLIKKGIGKDRVVLTGAPIFDGKNNARNHGEGNHVVFAPLHWDKEFEGNIEIYSELKKMPGIKVTTKLLSKVHDIKKYGDNVVVSDQWDEDCLKPTFELMKNTDLLVSNESGTLELIAMYFDIPVIFIDNFKPMPFLTLSERTIKEEKKIHPRPKGVDYTKNIKELPELIKINLANPSRLKEERKQVLAEEAGVGLLKKPVQNIINVIKNAIDKDHSYVIE